MKRSTLIGTIIGAAAVIGIGVTIAMNSGSSKSDNYSVALVTSTGGVDDKSFNQSAWAGIKQFGEKNHMKQGENGFSYLVSNDGSEIKSNLQQAVKAQYKLVVGISFMGGPAMKQVAKTNPNTQFAMVEAQVPYKNAASIMFHSEQSSYLAGVAAAESSKTGKIGFVGGVKGEVIEQFETGFKAGVLATNPKATFVSQYANTFTDAAKGKTIAAAMYASGVDVIFQAAGATGNGVFAEAKAENQNTTADKKVWVVGVDMDQKQDGNYTTKDGKKANFTLASAIKRVDNAVERVAKQGKDNQFPGGKTVTYGLKEQGVDIARDSMSESAWQATQKAKQQILDGKITVPTKLSAIK
ncbi:MULTISPECIES: BMP family lipoprotein [Leuconostoc]|uniref:BMP family lipoprotein n=1 Tax=Leuconostoc TaxID=1243 RepID=UPI000D50F4E3|nr:MULTISPECIES: BMP family ABC transporter substrate-binding protein [Leuconostoc]KAA8324524.1 BMP family ABC transporter substrate-binding protein [Leuconostoc carnosum]KAA8365568.1 BMP family ABC transporter substrate-binding protein [Leuconostoc carnosum]KAA8371596.1 BMP family ABC transporter substrate-binding protein [Leuconostoc carnosum]KAA8372109.1 BMP family ABC transporter substrate-binding protein [Leuconostoc carnosum]KAA8374641.1 BMP family ABC transporter substrate-binding prote